MIINADILGWAASYDGPLFHALLCDAPYEMEFMGKSWDNSGVAFNPETWRLLSRCLHPGAFLFVFAGTINDDLISVAMRQAGLRKYHKTAYWGYGSGFPKATDLPAQIDERAFQQWLATHEEERAILDRFRAKVLECRQSHKVHRSPTSRALVTAAHNAYRQKRQAIKAAAGFLKTNGTRRHQPKFDAKGFDYREKDNGYNSKEHETFDVVVPATDLAQAWDGYSYGGQMIKPAAEAILIFQKPYDGSPVDCITRTGAGALWIDGARIGTDGETPRGSGTTIGYSNHSRGNGGNESVDGRWPANLILSHSPSCNGACAPDCPVYRLGEQSGESESNPHRAPGGNRMGVVTYAMDEYTKNMQRTEYHGPGDSGTAARYFFQASYMYERLEAADPLFYCAKADRAEREAGLDPRQIALLGMEEVEETRRTDGRQTEHETGHLRTSPRRNTGPCIKPLKLTRYLATLLLPPDMYAPRRILCPFGGTGSEAIGAILAGWEEVAYVEREIEYVRIAEARAAYWRQRRHEFLDPSKPIEAKVSAAPTGQRDMFMEDL